MRFSDPLRRLPPRHAEAPDGRGSGPGNETETGRGALSGGSEPVNFADRAASERPGTLRRAKFASVLLAGVRQCRPSETACLWGCWRHHAWVLGRRFRCGGWGGIAGGRHLPPARTAPYPRLGRVGPVR
jgi:hypothetical protein